MGGHHTYLEEDILFYVSIGEAVVFGLQVFEYEAQIFLELCFSILPLFGVLLLLHAQHVRYHFFAELIILIIEFLLLN